MPSMDADPEKQGCNGILANTDDNDIPRETSPRPIHGWKWAIAYASMISTTFLFALDNSNVRPHTPPTAFSSDIRPVRGKV
ncbi:hypothetical protein N7481_000566 [Penicillium waksmanii]|uniref:uncharacterized protein n=1 Tax=Penicillium waksmanii TaxID=69791 RepID=UPI002546676D|nr:uncharacterized protein N7481_000566 [Penicillium waksmanii]KAJ6000157.1 hypothetical protein N7481_000566 [Penicillium waksmanii]